jgi:hypothetical protein
MRAVHPSRALLLPAALTLLLAAGSDAAGQTPPREDRPVEPFVPPPREPNPNPEVAPPPPAPEAKPVPDELLFDVDRPFGLEPELLERLARRADAYRAFATWFTSDETVRVARYDANGEATEESIDRYAYLLERVSGPDLRESRRRVDEEGKVRGGDIEDAGKFPPAYSWVFLFSSFHQPFFAYRDLGDRFEGFHWVRVLQFRGALPFTDGRDIREWEGLALVDAVSLTPVQILARPSAQRERISAMFDRWSQAFNIVGVRLAPRPFGYRGRVEFRMVREGLTFPTELRYDTFRAVGRRETVPISASVRTYDRYRFFKTGTTEEVRPPEPAQ